MIKKESSFLRCSNCHKRIISGRLKIHEMMCSTSHLRRSQYSIIKQKPLQKCIFCMEEFELEQINFHINLDCKHRLVPCIDCDDMFPLSLFTEHLEVCRARKPNQKSKTPQQEQPSSFMSSLMSGLNILGTALYEKGAIAAEYCNKKIEQNRPTAMLYLQQIKTKLSDTLQDLFESLAHAEDVEGMPRQDIRKIEIKPYVAKPKQKQDEQDQICTICYCELYQPQPIKQLSCKHFYHPSCIDKWLRINRTCPLCKADQLQQK